MAPRRPPPSDGSRQRAARIAAALRDELDSTLPTAANRADDPYRGYGARRKQPSRSVLRCPQCRARLLPTLDERGTELMHCIGCGGLWFEHGQLDDLITQVPAPLEAVPLSELRAQMQDVLPPSRVVKYRSCPHCNHIMERRNYGSRSGVIIDICRQHGIYLDPGELVAIETFIAMGGLALHTNASPENPSPPIASHPRSMISRLLELLSWL